MKVWDRAGIELATPDLQSDSHLLPDTLPTTLRSLVKKKKLPEETKSSILLTSVFHLKSSVKGSLLIVLSIDFFGLFPCQLHYSWNLIPHFIDLCSRFS